VLISLARQWLLRSGMWKLAVAGAGGLIQITLGGLGFALFHQLDGVHSGLEPGRANPDMARLVYMSVWVVAGVICCVIALALWIKDFTGRRIHHDA
jgi:hypothetical protein